MNNPLINPGLGTFVWLLVSFGILAFILMKWGWPMILKALKSREEAIAASLNEAAKAREEMKSLVAHNEELLRQAKMERDEMLRNARLTSEQIVEEARTKATAEADRIVEAARENINYEKMKAMTEPTICRAFEPKRLPKNSGMVLASSFWVMTLVLLPSISQARRDPINAFPRPIQVEATPKFQPNCPA